MTDDQTIVGGRYQLGAVLGRGGMAEVRRGVDLRLGRAVAVKRLSAQFAADPTFQERFRREATSAASLNHHTIAAVYDSGEESDPRTGVSIPYIVMELVEGSTLRDVLRSGDKLAPERALEIIQGVLEALSHSHAAGIIHRDIKPANVMLTPDGGVKVMDFGIARAATDTSNNLTQTAAVIGTAQYLSPEQARGESVDRRSDIYSTGCLLYELLLGRPPFVGESSVSVAYQHVREDPVPPSQLDPALGPEVDAITLKALAKSPADRYQSAREMSADISRVLGGQAPTASLPVAVAAEAAIPTTVVAAVPTAPGPSPEPEPERRTGRAVLIALLAFVLLAGIVFAVYRATAPDTGVASVTVPDLTGATKDAADQQLRDARLAPQFEDVAGPRDKTLNTVIGQDPSGGTSVQTGTTVLLRVNVGPADAEIPDDLVGKPVDDVVAELTKKGFTGVRTEPDSDPPKRADVGDVTEVDPDEGSSVALGAEIVVRYVAEAATPTTRTSPPSTTKATRTPTKSPTATATDDPSETDEPSDDPSSDEPSQSDEPSASDEPTSSKPTKSADSTASPNIAPANASAPPSRAAGRG